MKTIEIDDSLVLQHSDDIDQPLCIHRYTYLPYRDEPFDVKRVQVIAQIFHTELKHFDLRKATLVDSDERRPIYGFTFDSAEKHVAFLLKRQRHMMAYQQIEFIEVDGEIVPGCGRVFAGDLYRFRSFTAWLEHITTGQIQSVFVADCCVRQVDGGSSLLSIPDCTIDDLIACLKDEKELVEKELELNELTKGVTVDGVEVTVGEITKHMTQKAMLERTSEGAMN